MKKATGYRLQAAIVVATVLTSFASFAQEKGCVSLKTDGQVEESYVDAQGKPAKRLVAPSKVVPGTEVIWTITATNACDKAAEKTAIENNVPEHMIYVPDSAAGADAEIAFSTNGRDFKKAGELTVLNADGTTRPVRAEEIKTIRWAMTKPLAPKASAAVRYRAKVK